MNPIWLGIGFGGIGPIPIGANGFGALNACIGFNGFIGLIGFIGFIGSAMSCGPGNMFNMDGGGRIFSIDCAGQFILLN